MHEYSLVLALLEQVDRNLAAHPGAAVRRVHLRVGALSGVVSELLRTAFEVAREGTACDGAELVIQDVPAEWQCSRCERRFAAGDVLTCPDCGAAARLVAGEELHLMRLELEVADDV